MTTLTRRDVLVSGSAAVAGAALGCGAPTEPSIADALWQADASASSPAPARARSERILELPESASHFPIGIAAGSMGETGVHVITYAPQSRGLALKLWREAGDAVELAADLPVRPSQGGYVSQSVERLAPGADYRYAFVDTDGGVRSAIGSVKTAPTSDFIGPVTVGATSCAEIKRGPFHSLARMAREPLDFYLHLGDASYNDDAETLLEFRQKWRRTLADGGYLALRSGFGGYHSWDDHEIRNNYDPERLSPSVLAAGKDAFYEHCPVSRLPGDRLWRSQRWGRTLELFLLDCRSERLPSTRLTEGGQYISRAQLEWLKRGLLDSPCHFKVIANTVPIANFPTLTGKFAEDRWDGYPAQRAELLGFLAASGLSNVWFITGDFHLGMVMRVDRQGPGRAHWEIAAGPAANVSAMAPLLAVPGLREATFPPEQFKYVRHAYAATTFVFDPARDTVRVKFIEASDGRVTFDEHLRWGA